MNFIFNQEVLSLLLFVSKRSRHAVCVKIHQFLTLASNNTCNSNIKSEGFLDPPKQAWMWASNEESELEDANT